MKIALYIEDGLEQIVLTPESDTEKSILAKLHDDSRAISLKRGSFFRCVGGWTRYSASWRGTFDSRDNSDDSTMIVLTKPEPPPMPPDEKLWLWKNGDHYWAFRHQFPCHMDGGDPQTLGEPIGYAILKPSAPPSSGPHKDDKP